MRRWWAEQCMPAGRMAAARRTSRPACQVHEDEVGVHHYPQVCRRTLHLWSKAEAGTATRRAPLMVAVLSRSQRPLAAVHAAPAAALAAQLHSRRTLCQPVHSPSRLCHTAPSELCPPQILPHQRAPVKASLELPGGKYCRQLGVCVAAEAIVAAPALRAFPTCSALTRYNKQ